MRQHRAPIQAAEMGKVAHNAAAVARCDILLLGARLPAQCVQNRPPHWWATFQAAFRLSGLTV